MGIKGNPLTHICASSVVQSVCAFSDAQEEQRKKKYSKSKITKEYIHSAALNQYL
jgi:hypothetical protein